MAAAGLLNMLETDLNQRLCEGNHNMTAVVANWFRLLMVRSKAARKNAFPRVRNEFNGCNGFKKCRGQRAKIREVGGTCPPLTPRPLRT